MVAQPGARGDRLCRGAHQFSIAGDQQLAIITNLHCWCVSLFTRRIRIVSPKQVRRGTAKEIVYGPWRLIGSSLINVSFLRWRHNGRDSVSNHQPHDCLLNCLFRRRPKKTSKLRVTGLGARNSPGTGEFPAQKASTAENVSIWWRHHGNMMLELLLFLFLIKSCVSQSLYSNLF